MMDGGFLASYCLGVTTEYKVKQRDLVTVTQVNNTVIQTRSIFEKKGSGRERLVHVATREYEIFDQSIIMSIHVNDASYGEHQESLEYILQP